VVAGDADELDGNATVDGAYDGLVHTVDRVGNATNGFVAFGFLDIRKRAELAWLSPIHRCLWDFI